MQSDSIFLRSASGLAKLDNTAYDSEAVLQEALALYPEVIAGSTTAGAGEGRLMLIRREMPVPSAAVGGPGFSLDHLFVDSDCIPVLVEVKRSSDTCIRREVVGQMLDYAANATRYWPIDLLQASLQEQARGRKTTVEELIADLNSALDADRFWANVEANLTEGRIRLLFVADKLPDELVRVIEFLNEQMRPAEVLGIEVRQYAGGDHIAFVPHVIGQTTRAAQSKQPTSSVAWNEETFLAAAESRCSAPEIAFITALLTDVRTHGGRLSWGRGQPPEWAVGTPSRAAIVGVGAQPEHRSIDQPRLSTYVLRRLRETARG